MRAMSASQDKSAGKGKASKPVAGGVRPQIFLSSTTSKVISKSLDETEDLMAGYSISH